MKEQEIRDIIYDSNRLIDLISDFPQTYKTILKECCYKNTTMQFILRKKLNVLMNDGHIYKAIIPATRGGEVIYYHPKKEYNIIVEGTRTGENNIYCYKKSIKKGFYITMNEYHMLNCFKWIEKKDEKVVFLGNALMVI